MPRSSLLNIPYEGTREVKPESPPTVYQRIQVDEDMFGAGKGRALQQLGHAIGNIGSVIGEIDQKNQQEQADTQVRQVDTQLMKDMTTLQTEYSAKTPEEQVAGWDEYDKRARQLADDANSAVGNNPRAKKIMGTRAETYYRNAWLHGFAVKTTGVDKASDKTADARIGAAINTAGAANSEEAYEESIKVINGELSGKARRGRWSDDQLLQQQLTAGSAATGKFIGNMALGGNPSMAQEYFNKFRNRMTDTDQNHVQKMIDNGHAGSTIPNAVDNDIKGQPQPVPPRRPTTPPATIAPPRDPAKGSQIETGAQLASLVSGDVMSDAPSPGVQRLAQQSRGMVEQGNIDLNNRIVIKSEDGKYISTEQAFSVNIDGNEVLLPRVVNGVLVSEEEAVKHFKETGEHLGKFDSPEAADEYAKDLHDRQEKRYGPRGDAARTKLAQVGGTVTVSARKTPTGGPDVPIPGYAPEASSATIENYIVQQAKLRGIDPGTALVVYQSEGSSRWKSTVPGENSWGPYQLFTGASLKGDYGLGNQFYRDTGLDPSDPKTWRENIEYALNRVVEKGWGEWNGAKARGITGKTGVAGDAKAIPVGASAMYKMSQQRVEEDTTEEEPGPKTPAEARSIGAYIKKAERGDQDAMAKPGSNVIHAYNTLGKIRAIPPAPELESAIDKAAKASSVMIRITSAGQTSDRDPHMKDKPGGWTGSVRHNDGRAVDVDILSLDGKTLERNDPRRLAFLEEAAALGAGGTGAGYMSDSLKVHVGLTGASGQVGKGLGAYAGNAQERDAVAKGLARGNFDTSTQFASTTDSTGRVRYASLGTGVTSDAGPYVPPAGTRYAGPPGQQNPITALSSAEEVTSRIRSLQETFRAQGFTEPQLKNIESDYRAKHQKMVQEHERMQKEAEASVKAVVYGSEGQRPQAETSAELIGPQADPKLREQFYSMPEDKQRHYLDQIVKNNSNNAKRTPTAEDTRRFNEIMLMPMSSEGQEKFAALDPYGQGLPTSQGAKIAAEQTKLLKTGVIPDPVTRLTSQVVKLPNVIHQFNQAGIPLNKDGLPPVELQAAIKAEIGLHLATHDNKPPSKEEADLIVNGLLREMGKPPSKFPFFGFNIPGTGSQMRMYEVPMSKAEEDAMVSDYRNRTGKVIRSAKDVPPWEQATWRVNQRRLRSPE